MLSSGEKRKISDLEGDNSREEAPKRQKVDETTQEESGDTPSESEGMDTTSSNEKQRKRKRIDRRPSSGTIVQFQKLPMDIIAEMLTEIDGKENQEENPGSSAKIIDNKYIRIYPTDEETKRERKQYRREYNRNPVNIQKRRAKAQTPEEIEKRKKSNEDEETKERKKVCATGRRKVLAYIKDTYPDLYEETKKKFVPELPPKPKKQREKTKLSIKIVSPFEEKMEQ